MKRAFTDQMGRTVEINFPPQRIISLVPSQTELLYDLGLSHEVAGQTLFCIHPADMHETKPRIGGTKKFNFSKIEALRPDLIIGNKEENEQSQVEALMRQYPVWMSDIHNLDEALDMIVKVGDLVARQEKAGEIVREIRQGFISFDPDNKKRVAYLIWKGPWMAAGHDTFINDMLHRCGLANVFENEISRYPEIGNDQLKHSAADLILLSSEPFPFSEKHMEEIRALCPDAEVMLVDGEMFSWYGSRLRKAPAYLRSLFSKEWHKH